MISETAERFHFELLRQERILRKMPSNMTTDEKLTKDGLERWLDERIRVAVGMLPNPFERRIAHLRERVESVQERLDQILTQIEQDQSRSED